MENVIIEVNVMPNADMSKSEIEGLEYVIRKYFFSSKYTLRMDFIVKNSETGIVRSVGGQWLVDE